jgi:hypothetical protein
VGDFRDDRHEVGRAFRHLELDIVAEVGEPADLCKREGAREVGILAVKIRVGRRVVGDVRHSLLAAHNGGGCHDGVDQGLEARAAADVAVLLEPVAHFVARWVLVL